MTDTRTMDGMRDAVALLTALHANDIRGAESIVNNADAGPTIAALASAWLSAVKFLGGDPAEMIASMRGHLR